MLGFLQIQTFGQNDPNKDDYEQKNEPPEVFEDGYQIFKPSIA